MAAGSRRPGPAIAASLGCLEASLETLATAATVMRVAALEPRSRRPGRFWGGIVGAFFAALAGALVSGVLLPQPGVPAANPPGVGEAVWAIPGSLLALLASYLYGAHRDTARGIVRD